MERLNTGTSEGSFLSITKKLLFSTLEAEMSSVWLLQKILYKLKMLIGKNQKPELLFLPCFSIAKC